MLVSTHVKSKESVLVSMHVRSKESVFVSIAFF